MAKHGGLYDERDDWQPSLFERLTVSWMYKPVRTARKNGVPLSDLRLPADQASEKTCAEFLKNWDAASARGKGSVSLLKVLFKTFGMEMMTAGIFKLAWGAFVIMGAFFFTRSLLGFVNGDEPFNSTKAGWALTIGFFVDAWLLGLALQRMTYGCLTTGIKAKGALLNAVARKAFSMASISKENASDVVSFAASDISKIFEGMQDIHYLWTAPLEAATIMGLLGMMVAEYALPGVGVIILVYILQYWFGYLIIKNKMANGPNTQERGSIIQEVLPSMKLVKYYAWEQFFEKEISEIRKRELAIQFKIALIKTLNVAMVFGTPPTAACVIFSSYEMRVGRLKASIAFTSLSLFNIMRFPLVVLPKAMRAASDAYAAIARVEKFLLEPVKIKEVPRGEMGVKINNATFEYEGKDFQLKVPKFQVKRGEVVAVVGRVGAGKSSIVNAILGNMTKTSGEINAGGRIAYVPQNAWCQNLSLKDNILFGTPMDEKKYAQTIHACALELDLQILPKGDDSFAGLRGVNLSGGQRQRLNLARCAYADADLVLLDNALSAVDHHTAHHIFQHCIKDMFADKAVILITHQLEFLPRCDNVAIMNDGDMLYFGSWCTEAQQLLSNYLPASHLLHAAGGAEERKEPPKKAQGKVTSRLTLSPTNVADKVDKKPQGKVTMSHAMRILCKEAHWLLLICTIFFFLAAQTSRQMSDYWVRQWTGDSLNLYGGKNVTRNRDASALYVGTYGGLTAAFITFMLFRGATFFWAILRAGNRLHSRMVHKVLYAPLGFFFQTPVGDLLVSFSKDQDIMDEQLPDVFHYTGIYGLILLSTTILVSITISLFSAFTGALLVLTAIMLYFYLPAATALKRVKTTTAGEVVGLIAEVLDGLNVVQAYSKKDYFVGEATRRIDLSNKALFSGETLNGWLAFYCDFYGAILVLSVAAFAVAYRETLGSAAVGLAFSNTIQMLVFYTWVVRCIADSISMLSSSETIAWLANFTPQEGDPKQKTMMMEGGKDVDNALIVSSGKPAANWPKHGEIIYDNVYMKYAPSAPWALKGVTFQIHPAEKIGVVGRTGSGKSTLLLALYRMFELGKGRIVIDGVDIATMPLNQLRRGLSVIPQEPVVFSGTVRSNLDPFKEHTDHELWEVVRKVGLDELVTSQGGLDGKVDGTGGQAWSLGQQQLCCLARAALRKVPILCLDEATAAMDPHTEQLVQAIIGRIFQDRTAFTIAHRLDTVIQSDKVMVMEAGVLMEMDAPKTLLDNPESMFSKLVDKSGAQAAAALRELAAEHFALVR